MIRRRLPWSAVVGVAEVKLEMQMSLEKVRDGRRVRFESVQRYWINHQASNIKIGEIESGIAFVVQNPKLLAWPSRRGY